MVAATVAAVAVTEGVTAAAAVAVTEGVTAAG